MNKQNKAQNILKRLEKRLSLENLESRQLLSASPLNVDADLIETSAYATSNTDLQVDLALQAEGEGEGGDDQQGDDQQQNDKNIPVSATGKKLTATFPAEEKVPFTVVIKATDSAGKVTTTFKTITPTAKKIQNGAYTFTYTGKENCQYDLTVVNGKYTKKEYTAANGQIPDNITRATGSVTTLSTLKLAATPYAATPNSITFQQKSGEKLESIDNLVLSAKFDGAKTATEYTVSGNQLVDANGEPAACTITLNEEAGTVTISGLAMNTKQTIQVAQTNEDGSAVSAYSSKLTISTTKEQNAPPIDVSAGLHYNDKACGYDNSVELFWEGTKGTTYTVTYSYTDATGKVITKTATKKATLYKDVGYDYIHDIDVISYFGEYTVSHLLPNTKYTFSVIANKNKNYDASVPVVAESVEGFTITTPMVFPTPQLKKVSATDSTITVQITNWDELEPLLQDINKYDRGGEFSVTAYKVGSKGEDSDGYASFKYQNDGEGNCVWAGNNYNNGTMEISSVDGKNVATVTLTGLDSNTNYNIQADAESHSTTTNFLKNKSEATSKFIKMATTKVQHDSPDYVYADLNDNGSVTVGWSWYGNEGVENPPKQYFTISYSYTDANGKVVTKTATKSATLNAGENDGSYTLSKLQPGTTYTFSVSANKTKLFDASLFVDAKTDKGNTITTPTQIPAPTLKKASATNSSITFQVTNWDKMEAALQEIDSTGVKYGGTFIITQDGADINKVIEEQAGYVALFYYDGNDATWNFYGGNDDCTIAIAKVNNKNVATITIGGLTANTTYRYRVTGYSDVINDNINTVLPATSKVLKVKTNA